MLAKCALIFLMFGIGESAKLSGLDIDSSEKLFVRAAREILGSFYAKITTSVFITIGSETNETEAIVGEIVRPENLPLTYVIEESEYVNDRKHRRYFNLIIVDTPESFKRVFARMSETSFDYTGFYTILVTGVYDKDHYIVESILKDCWSLYISNVHILTRTAYESAAMLYTFYPYTQDHCEQVKPILQNYFIDDSFVLSNQTLFPEKFRNFHKCPLTLSTYHLVPFMILTPQPNGSYHTDGIDGITFRVISQQLNFTPIVRLSSTNLVRRITAKTHNAIVKPELPRSLELLDDKSVNMSMGAIIYSSERTKNYSISFPYYYASWVFAIPPGKPFSPLRIVFVPFKYIIWTCICTIFLCTMLVVVALKFSPYRVRGFVLGPQNDSPVFNMLNICFGGSVSYMPSRNFARSILLIWLVMSMVLKTAYQSRLYDFLRTQPRMSPQDYRNKIFSSNLKVYVTETFYQIYYDGLPQVRDRLEIYSGNMSELENLRSSSFDGVYMATTAAIAHYNMEHFRRGHIMMTHDRTLVMPYSIFFRKHSCLTQVINVEISKYTSNGLISVWVTRLTNEQLAKVYMRSEQLQQQAPKKIALDQIRGIFVICAFFYLISGAVLVMEILTVKYEFLRVFMDFCTFK